MSRKPIIAIDGPAGSGKSTLAKSLAKRLGLLYIDSGAMYRAVAWEAKRRGVDFEDPVALAGTAQGLDLRLEYDDVGTRIWVGGTRLEHEIRTPEISNLTSQKVANVRGVREALVKLQWELGRDGGVVMEGRDIGTVVFQDADLKIYFDVSAEERARRRISDLQQRGIPFDEAAVIKDILRRDYEDTHRQWGSLKRADDAVLITGDGKSVAQSVEEVVAHLAARGKA